MNTDPFKICTSCSKRWKTFEAFLADPEIKLAGYQVAFKDLNGGLFFFTHLHENCFTTLALPVKEFTGLSSSPILASRGTRPDHCPDFCLRQNALDPCPIPCECAWVREIMQIIRNWKKQAA